VSRMIREMREERDDEILGNLLQHRG
jgi:hypothetical protein